MDPITIIVTALTVGAAAGIQATTSEAIKDAYNKLKALIQRKFAGKPTATLALVEHEKKPDIWKAPLEEELRETGAGQDDEIIEVAKRLMALVNPQQAAMGNYNMQITGNVQGIVQGDNPHVIQTFGNMSKEK